MAPVPPDRLFRVEALALLLASRFILRDLFDCGPNLFVAALSWWAFVAWRDGHEGRAAAALGLATALKWTPALLVVWFALKRQWRMAAGSALATALFTLTPILVQGPAGYARHMKAWASNLAGAMRSTDPFSGVLGPDTAGNIALRPALARALAALGVPADVAFVSILAALGTLAALAVWSLRHPAGDRGDPSLAPEYAAAALLALLLSPVAWRSHAVAALAALTEISRRLTTGGERSPFLVAWLTAWVLAVLVLNPTLTGGTLQALIDQASVTTWLLVALFFMVIRGEKLS
jgi:alpha-1,2-mannosyltransferase